MIDRIYIGNTQHTTILLLLCLLLGVIIFIIFVLIIMNVKKSVREYDIHCSEVVLV